MQTDSCSMQCVHICGTGRLAPSAWVHSCTVLLCGMVGMAMGRPSVTADCMVCKGGLTLLGRARAGEMGSVGRGLQCARCGVHCLFWGQPVGHQSGRVSLYRWLACRDSSMHTLHTQNTHCFDCSLHACTLGSCAALHHVTTVISCCSRHSCLLSHCFGWFSHALT